MSENLLVNWKSSQSIISQDILTEHLMLTTSPSDMRAVERRTVSRRQISLLSPQLFHIKLHSL